MSEDKKVRPEISMDELVQDLQTIGNVVQQHDQSVFQIIASLNAIQAILLQKDICTEKDMSQATETEAKVLQEKIMKMVAGNKVDEEPVASIPPEADEVAKVATN